MTVRIANRIYIDDPTDDIEQWAKDNLEFPNPEYEKKQRMGFWVGRTPKVLRLYEWDGHTLILPFGVCREIMPMIWNVPIECDFRQDEEIDYGDPVPLYDYQQEAVEQMTGKKYGILKSAAGSGKTQMGIALIKQLKRRALWLCHTHDLLIQSRDRALRYMDEGLIGTITEGKVNIGTGVTFATVQTMANLDLPLYRDCWDTVVIDECFPGDTAIETDGGFKKISDITVGDRVLAISGNKLVYRKVDEVFVKIPHTIVKVQLSNGDSVYCTDNHPILTERGYVNAGQITPDDAVCCLRKGSGSVMPSAAEKIQFHSWEKTCVLFGRMRKKVRKLLDGRTPGKKQADDDGTEQKERVRTDEGTQPDAGSGNPGAYEKHAEGNRTQACRSWRKRERPNRTAIDAYECVEEILPGDGIRNTDKDSKGKWLSNLLQGRHCDSGRNGCGGSRRFFTLFSGKTDGRPQKRRAVEFIRVESVEVHEQTSDGTFGGVCADGRVYNLSVEHDHNYFANGMNVHNCHRVGSSATTFTRYERVLNNLSARHKYGLTATPERSDGLIKATFAFLGQVAWEVDEDKIADRIMKATVRKVSTDAEITDDCLNVDGTINYIQLIDHLTHDPERNKLIARKIIEEKGHSCLILSERLEHLEAIRNLLPYEMQEESAYITGKMQSKKAKAEREQAIEDMRSGKKKYLFASYSLAREGLDIPNLDRLFMASPVKFSSVVIQSIGRIERACKGKGTPVAYDFVDTEIGFCDRAYRERKKHYRKIGVKIDESWFMDR